MEKGDSVPLVHILPVYVFSRPVDLRRYRKLVDAVKKVYPIARIAKAKMAAMEEELCRLPTKKAQKAYIRQVYNQIKEEYTPVLKHMTRTQGKVLLKLIDRETEYTAYEVLKEFRGGFVAGFWQGVSRIFGQNLKSEYDKQNEDRMIEHASARTPGWERRGSETLHCPGRSLPAPESRFSHTLWQRRW